MTTNQQSNTRMLSARATLGLCLFLGVAAFFLWTEHRAHLFGILPYLILAACPLIHLFMHRGHGGHGADLSEDRGMHRHGGAP